MKEVKAMNDNLDVSQNTEDEVTTSVCKDEDQCNTKVEKSEPDNLIFDALSINKGEQCIPIINHYKIFNTYGDNANFTVADSIEKSSIQGREGYNSNNNTSPDENILLDDEKNFEKYVNKYKNTKSFLTLVAIASLEKIEETNFEFVCNQLKNHLDKFILPIEDDKLADSMFESRTSLFKNTFAIRVAMKRNTHTGMINTNCICFSDEGLAMKIRNWLWNIYPQFRDAIIDWLIELSKIDKWFLCATAQNSIAEYATIDFEYSLDRIFTKLYKNPKHSEISTLSFVIEKLYDRNICNDNLEKMLFNWFGYENNDLWMVSFRLCAKGYANKCKEKLSEVLNKYIFNSNYRDDRYFLYIMGFAHRSNYISEKLIDVLQKQFEQQKTKYKKDQTAQIFLWLLLYDFFTTDENYPNLAFVDCANTLEFRKQMRPILQHILGDFQLRTKLYEILNAFFAEYKTNSKDWKQTEKFIRELAFTGKKQDFDKTINWLEKNKKNEQLIEFSKYMIAYLNDTLLNQK